MRVRLRILPFVVLSLAVWGASTLVAQSSETQSSETPSAEDFFADSIGVEVVNIDVVVTDRKGRVVKGLGQDDFELRIDGQKVPIANFYALGSKDTVEAEAPLPLAGVDSTTPLEAVSAANHMVVYFDSFYLKPNSRQNVLRDLPIFLEQQVKNGTRIMLMSHDRASRVVTPFTNDLDELKRGLAELEDSPVAGFEAGMARRRVLNTVNEIYRKCDNIPVPDITPCDSCLDNMIQAVRSYSLGLLSERREAMAALSRVVSTLGVLDGKKAFLHVSDGIEQQPGIEMYYYLGEQLCQLHSQKLSEYYLRQDVGDLNDVVHLANSSRVTFYTLEGAGLRNFESASALVPQSVFRPSNSLDMTRVANLQGTLTYLAEETGGKAMLNTTQFEADLGKIAEEFTTYYSLGYQPTHTGRGRPHRVSVKVPATRRYELDYRRSFLHKKPEQRLADRALGSVMFGVADNPLAVEVRVGAQSPATEGRRMVTLDVAIPIANLTLIEQDGVQQGRLAAVIAAPDKNGKKTVVRRQKIEVRLPVDTSRDAAAVYQFGINVELVPGEYRLGVGLWDEVADEGSFVGLPVKVQQVEAKIAARSSRRP